jgi:hypothetical protein
MVWWLQEVLIFEGPPKVFFMEALNDIRRNTDSGLQAN